MESLELNAMTNTIATQAVNKVMQYFSNFSLKKYYLCEDEYIYIPTVLEAFHGNTKHYVEKWKRKANNPTVGGSLALLQLWYELDEENKEAFTKHVINEQ